MPSTVLRIARSHRRKTAAAAAAVVAKIVRYAHAPPRQKRCFGAETVHGSRTIGLILEEDESVNDVSYKHAMILRQSSVLIEIDLSLAAIVGKQKTKT
jgi:hypothetical protein